MPWRDAEGNVASDPYQTWIDRQIVAAQARGEFDELPGAGKPLPHLGNSDDPDWWIKRLVERENLDMSAALPPQLALRKQAHELPERVVRERSEQAVRDLVDDFNTRVRDCWRQPVQGPPVVVRTIDPEALVAHWREHHAERPAVLPAAEHRESPPTTAARRAVLWRALLGRRSRRVG